MLSRDAGFSRWELPQWLKPENRMFEPQRRAKAPLHPLGKNFIEPYTRLKRCSIKMDPTYRFAPASSPSVQL
jgi:hypothetical protein